MATEMPEIPRGRAEGLSAYAIPQLPTSTQVYHGRFPAEIFFRLTSNSDESGEQTVTGTACFMLVGEKGNGLRFSPARLTASTCAGRSRSVPCEEWATDFRKRPTQVQRHELVPP